MNDELKNKIQSVRNILNETIKIDDARSPGIWKKCSAHDGKCKCESIWSIELDAPVCSCNSKWGDGEGTEFFIEYGDIGEDAKQANKNFICNASIFTGPAAKSMLIMLDALEKECNEINFPDEDRPNCYNALMSVINLFYKK